MLEVGSWKLEASLKFVPLFGCSIFYFRIFCLCFVVIFKITTARWLLVVSFQFPYRTACWIYHPFVYDTVYFYFITVLPFVHSQHAKKSSGEEGIRRRNATMMKMRTMRNENYNEYTIQNTEDTVHKRIIKK